MQSVLELNIAVLAVSDAIEVIAAGIALAGALVVAGAARPAARHGS